MVESIFGSFEDSLIESCYALLPLLLIYMFIQIFILKSKPKQFLSILYGLIITFVGLTLFLWGTNISFIKVGSDIGQYFAGFEYKWIPVIIGLVIGCVVTLAEPAVKILNDQIEEATSGYINKKMVLIFLSIGVALSVSLAILRIYMGIPLMYFLLPGYIIIFILTKFASPLFVSIAFDSGGVVTGPMIATFLITMTLSLSNSLPGSSPILYGLGTIGLVAMLPILSILILGVIYEKKRVLGGLDE